MFVRHTSVPQLRSCRRRLDQLPANGSLAHDQTALEQAVQLKCVVGAVVAVLGGLPVAWNRQTP